MRTTIIRFFSGGTTASLMLAAVAYALPARAQQAIVSFDVPGALRTHAWGINTAGTVTGDYTDSHHKTYGFMRSPDGQFSTFGAPGDLKNLFPRGLGINLAGEIAGNYLKYGGEASDGEGGTFTYYFDESFLRLADGTIFDITPTNAYWSDPSGINDQGTVAGTYSDANDGSSHFFLRAPDGTVTEFDPEPGASPASIGNINPQGTVTGSHYDTNGNLHSFLRTAQGAVTVFDAPGGVGQGTLAIGINPSGAITGYYYDTNFVAHGFLRSKNGQITTIDPPGSTSTNPVGITPNGTIAGYYSDADGTFHGFLYAKNGQISTIDPQASIATFITGINPTGEITGYYVSGSHTHSFLFQSGAGGN